MGDQTSRIGWRQAVRRSRLPNGVKVTLLAHSETSSHHHHDDDLNVHGVRRDRLAALCGVDESTVRRHYRIAERTGWLLLHERGHQGKLQQTYHYITPSASWTCSNCDEPYRIGRQVRRQNDPE
jgi:hypothetical protein